MAVGYSYYVQQGDFNFTDDAVARDNLYALLDFYLFKFPERQGNELWISGESYAGIYVPYLAWQIDQWNAQSKNELPESLLLGVNAPTFKFNFKGYIVGNGVANWKYDTIPAFIESAFWHGLYDIDLYNRIYASGCKKEFEYITFHAENMTEACQEIFLEFEYYVQGINVYDVYGICWGPNGTQIEKPKRPYTQYKSQLLEDVKEKVGDKESKHYATQMDYTPWSSLNLFPNKRSEKQ